MRVVLVHISSVSCHEAVEGSHESCLTRVICEVEPLQIVQKHMARHILNAGDLSTFIHTFSRPKYFSSSMSHYFAPAGSSSSADSNIVVALNPEAEEPLAPHHVVIGFLIVGKGLCVVNVVANIATATAHDSIDHIRANNHPDHSANI